jgi:hypothetical protein
MAFAQDGTTAYDFLSVTPSSHVYALGGHNLTIIDDDINLIEQNPALLGPEVDHQVGLNYMHYLGSSNFMGVRYGQGINDRSAFAVGIQYNSYGSITSADIDGTITGTFNASDVAVNLTYSHDITENMRGGINVKYIGSSYGEYSAAAIATDLGINYYNPDNDLSLSIVAKNLGGQIKKFNNTKDNLPWDIQVGWSQTMSNSPFRLSVTAYNLRKWKLPYYEPEDRNSTTSKLVERNSFGTNLMRHLVFGVELVPNEQMYIALGYNYKTRTDMSNYNRNLLSGFSIGAGLRVHAFGFGIAFAQPHTGATTFMFNMSTSIGELLR